MSFRLAWVTDIHLNFVDEKLLSSFCRTIADIGTSALIIGGDIAEAPSIEQYLKILEEKLEIPIYFVLGNHDFYRSSIRRVRVKVTELARRSKHLTYLTAEGVVELTPTTGLVGHDGWADARLGDYERSKVFLNDYMLIDELSGLTARGRRQQLELLGDEAAAHFREHLPAALERYRRLYVLTHVPPFREAAWHKGGLANDEWLPHFSSGVVGETLREIVGQHTDCNVTVLCGHTHGRGVATILPNLVVRTGGAEYGAPGVEELIDLEHLPR
jgi:predicted MPP superfamily phosphohydrolase